MNDTRRKLNRILVDSSVDTIIVEHRDRLACMNAGLIVSALKAQGRRLIAVDDSELDDDLVRDMTEVLTFFVFGFIVVVARNIKHKSLESGARCLKQ